MLFLIFEDNYFIFILSVLEINTSKTFIYSPLFFENIKYCLKYFIISTKFIEIYF